MKTNYMFRIMMLTIMSFVFSESKLMAQVNVNSTGGTSTASYTTLNAAFVAINSGTHTGVIDILIVGNTTEPATPNPLLASGGTSSYTAITIKPSGGNWIINSNAAPTASRGVIELSGADNVTIDGDDLGTLGSQNLTVQVASLATTGLAAVRLSSNSTTGTDGANNVTVRNLNIIGSRNSATSTTTNYGIVMSNSSAIGTGAYSSLNTLIENNVITRCYRAIYANGSSMTYPNTGLIIRNNVLGSATAVNNIGLNGIFVSNTGTTSANAALIEGNDIRVGDVNPAGSGYAASISGIELAAGSQFVKVSRNNIHDIMQPSTSGYGSFGINLTSSTSSNSVSITNNFIWNIIGSRYTAIVMSGFVSYGIRFNAASTGHEVINNTIQISNSTTGSTSNYVNYGVAFASGATVSKFLNNIIVNNNVGTGTYAVYCVANSALSTALVNNNNYYVPSGNIGYYAGANQATIGAWKTATAMDANSWNVAPNFVSATDLHLTAAVSLMESNGASVATTNNTVDFDGQTRPGPVGSVNGGATNPDIGADEFDGIIAPVPVITFISATPALTTQCSSSDPRLISVNATTPSGVLTSVLLNYSINGVAQTALSMVNTAGSTYEVSIPTPTPLNAVIAWNVIATNDAGISITYNGTSYQDQTLLGVTAIASSTPGTVCENAPATVSVSLTSTEASTSYTTPSITNPTTDEDLGSVVITQGATTILSNTTTGGSLVGTIGTATGTAGSFSNFTNFGPYAMTAGQTYNFSLTSITQGTINYGNSMAIFIDYNRNGSFTDAGEAVYLPAATTSGPHTETGSFTIPLSALNGKTRMRVYCLETTITSAATTSGYGEYEDYMLNISSANAGGGASPLITSATWTDGTTTLGTGNPFTVNPPANTTYSATVLSLGCTVISSTTTVNTIPLPAAPLATNSSQCGTQVPTASVSSNSGASGTGQYYWYNAPTGGTIVQSPPLGAFTTFYSNDFASTTIGAGASLTGVASLSNVPGKLQLTPNLTSQVGGLVVNAGVNALAYQVDFDFSTNPAGGADGFSYSFGDDVNTTATAPSQEMGSGSKFKVSFDAYGAMPNAAGIYLLYNNTATSFNASTTGVLGYVANSSWVGQANNHVTIAINDLGQVTLTLNGTALFTNVQLPAAYLSANKATWKHAIAGRTGGISMEQTIDNLVIQSASYGAGSTTYNTLVPTTTTFHVSEVGTNGCYSATTPVTVTVLSPSPVSATISSTLGCIGDSIVLEAISSATPAYTYSWASLPAAGGLLATAGDSVIAVPTVNGTYSYVVTATNGTCTATDTVTTTINNVIPFDPTVPTDYLNVCIGATTAPIVANAVSNISGSLSTVNTGGNGCTNGNMLNITTGANPLVLKSADVRPNITGTQNVMVYYKTGTYVGSETNVGAWTLLGTYSINGTNGVLTNVDFADVNLAANTTYGFYFNFNASYTNLATTYSNPDMTITTGAGFCTAFSGPIAARTFNGKFYYEKPIPTTITWFPTSTGGTQVGTGSPLETIGTTVLPNGNTQGAYEFWAAGYTNGCYSNNRTLVTVNVSPIVATLIPDSVTCNGGNNGTFALGTVTCGSGNFEYSLDNGLTFEPIPTDLIAGTYSIIIRDIATLEEGSPIVITIGEPAMPSMLAASNVTYYDATLSWTTTGNETSWTVIYGPTGFDPATAGISVTASSTSILLDNVLTENTSYDFYVFANCGPAADTAGPFTFTTDQGFMAYDNACPPSGFIDISSTGTDLNLTDDSEAGVTLPFAFPYQGTSITQLTVGNNGGIQLGTLTGQVGYGGNMTTLAGNFLFAWGDDMDDETGNVYWQVQGTSPNQVAIFQWNNQNNFSNGAGTVTYQIQLQENGEIYYVYNDVVFGGTETADDYAANADIGISGPTSDLNVSNNNATYLQNNSCVHFYYALCPNPINATILAVAPDYVSLDWSAGLYGETNWTVIYGPDGFDPASGTGMTQTTATSDIIIPGLTQNTAYDFYIYSECAADNLTSGGLLVNVLTPPVCSNPTAFTVNALTDTLDASWNWAAIPGYPVNLQYFNIGYVNALPGYTIQTNGEIVNTGSINLYDTIPDANLLAGGVYQVYIQAVCDQVGDTSAWVGPITVVMPLDNDVPCGAETLSLATDYLFNNNGATVDFNETNIAPPATGAQTTDGWANSTLNGTTWFKFVAPASGSVRIDNTLTTYSGQTAVYDAALCSDYSNNFVLLAANDDAIGGTSPASNFTVCGLTPGDEYLIMHDGTGTAGNYSIRVTEIVLEAGTFLPTAQICYGSTIDLTTTITGNDNGGVWSAPIASVNASISGSTFNSNGLGEAVYNFQYRVTDGCAYDSIVSTVQVVAPMSAGTDGTITVCKNQPVDLINVINGNIDLGGTWYNQSTPLAGSEITASSNAGSYNYNYVIGNGVCPDDTSNVVVTVLNTCDYLSLNEQVFAGVSVYPNPSTGLVYVESDNNFKLEVTDAEGRTVATAQEVKANNTTTIDLNQVQVGVYFIKLSNADSSKVYRIVVE